MADMQQTAASAGTLGRFEVEILVTLLRTGAHASQKLLREEMEATLSKSVAVGALGTTIERLAERGLVDVDVRGPRPVRGGRRTKVYSISPDGNAAVLEEHGRMQRLWSGVKLPGHPAQAPAALAEQQRQPLPRPRVARPFVV